MQYFKGEGKAICEYCGNIVYVDDRSDEQRSYEFERGKYRAKAENAYSFINYCRSGYRSCFL